MIGHAVLGPQVGVDPCPWLVGETECGLLFGHDGDHLEYVPWVPLPFLHPLDLLFPRRDMDGALRCPYGHRIWFPVVDGPCHVIYSAAWAHPVEVQDEVRFEPCGCTFRILEVT